MIISASRRTDIPAFYAAWFMNRIRDGYCIVPNPFNSRRVSHISLKPEDVDVIVFWTRNPQPLMPYLAELDARGIRYYFQYTLMNNPRPLDPLSPPVDTAIKHFRNLSELIGPEKVIWRYDPILFSEMTDLGFHGRSFELIARALRNHTRRSIVSIVDVYKKNKKRIQGFSKPGFDLDGSTQNGVAGLMPALVDMAHDNGMEIFSCAEEIDLKVYGIHPGKCIDDIYIQETFGKDVTHRKDPSQRKACGCVISRDIGMYDSCLFGCRYCYATSSFEQAKINHQEHDPDAPSLLGRHGTSARKE